MFVRRTRATLRSAEFGFLGVVVYTRVHTPRLNGFALRAGALSLRATSRRLWRTSWLIVGIFPAVFVDLIHTWIARRAARNRLTTYPAGGPWSRIRQGASYGTGIRTTMRSDVNWPSTSTSGRPKRCTLIKTSFFRSQSWHDWKSPSEPVVQ